MAWKKFHKGMNLRIIKETKAQIHIKGKLKIKPSLNHFLKNKKIQNELIMWEMF